MAILVGWFWSRQALEELGRGFRHAALGRLWVWLVRFVVPMVLAVVVYFAVTEQVIPAAQALTGE